MIIKEIKEFLGLSDKGMVEAITESPYLQYFIGLDAFQMEAPFNVSTMTHFCKRFDLDYINQINELTVHKQEKKKAGEVSDKESSDNDDDVTGGSSSKCNSTTQNLYDQPHKNHRNLLIDATCALLDIAYPTDLNLLNEAREKLEDMIDTLHKPLNGKERKPHTYRIRARK